MDLNRNLITNGRFDGDLNNWYFDDAVAIPNGGKNELGCVRINDGGFISQLFSIPVTRKYMLHIAVRSDSAITGKARVRIEDNRGGAHTRSFDLTTSKAGEWQEYVWEFGIGQGNFKLVIESDVDGVEVDDVWLWNVFISRSQIAAQVADRLGAVATQFRYSTTPSWGKPEGSYTLAIDSALRSVQATNIWDGSPDIRWLKANAVDDVVEAATAYMLNRASMDASILTDISAGGRTESYSQIFSAISKFKDGSNGNSGPGRIETRRLYHASEEE